MTVIWSYSPEHLERFFALSRGYQYGTMSTNFEEKHSLNVLENQTRSQILVSGHFGHIDSPVCIWHKYPPFLALVSFISMSEELFGGKIHFQHVLSRIDMLSWEHSAIIVFPPF